MPVHPGEPKRTSPYAAACLEALRGCDAAACLSLGGAFGLAHYDGFGTSMNSSAPDSNWLDGSLYPDVPVPRELTTLAERVDFVVRVCGAWDFGLMPRPATLRELRAVSWRPAVEEANLLTSCAWHLLSEWHGLPPARYLGPRFPEIERDPWLAWI